jgi:hypothetical protein
MAASAGKSIGERDARPASVGERGGQRTLGMEEADDHRGLEAAGEWRNVK